jgi:hypothetical protein
MDVLISFSIMFNCGRNCHLQLEKNAKEWGEEKVLS